MSPSASPIAAVMDQLPITYCIPVDLHYSGSILLYFFYDSFPFCFIILNNLPLI